MVTKQRFYKKRGVVWFSRPILMLRRVKSWATSTPFQLENIEEIANKLIIKW